MSSKDAFIVPVKTEEPIKVPIENEIDETEHVDLAEYNRMRMILLKRERLRKNKEYFDKHPQIKDLKEKVKDKEQVKDLEVIELGFK